jgi:hypothetical protein
MELAICSTVDIQIETCLPMAPVLPSFENGDFGSSPFLEQLTGKPITCLPA